MKRIRPSLLILACLAAALVPGTAIGHQDGLRTNSLQLELPDFGSSADSLLSTGEERRLGQAFMHSVRKSLPVIDDPFPNDYINTLGHRLAEASGNAGGRFSFFLIDDPVVNAFAGPDGHIGIYAGLMLAAETESELSAVIAHEMAHVTQRHLMRAYEDSQKMTLPATALMVGAAILGAQISPDAGLAAITGIQAAALQRQISFTRQNEKEADRLGIAMLSRAGFDPYAMAGFFERLAKTARIQDSSAPEMLRTHPVTTDRISDALSRAEDYGHRQQPDSLSFHLTRADLRQRSYRRPEQAIEHFRATLREGRHANLTAERYGYALALARDGQLAAARKISKALRDAHPRQGELVALDAKLAQRSGASAEALSALRAAFHRATSSLPLRLAYAEALIDAGEPSQALELLEPASRTNANDPQLFALLAQAAIKANDQAATYRYRAEHHYSLGELEPAIRQLEVALRQGNLSYHDASRLQARLDELKAEKKIIEDDPWN